MRCCTIVVYSYCTIVRVVLYYMYNVALLQLADANIGILFYLAMDYSVNKC